MTAADLTPVPDSGGAAAASPAHSVTLTQLRYFVEAASRLSMTEASLRLHVAQSAVSSAVAALERQLGTQLFIRKHSKGLVLTPAGRDLLRDARSVLDHLGEVVASAQGDGDTVRGTVRLAVMVTLMPFVLPSLLTDLRSRYPDLDVIVTESAPSDVGAALCEGSVDLAIGYDLLLSEDIDHEVVAEAPPYVLLPPTHRLARQPQVSLSELASEPMVLLDLPGSRDYFIRLLRDSGIQPDVRYRTTNYEAVRALVARGHGFAILNQVSAGSVTYDGGRAVARPLADEVPALPVVLSWLDTGRLTGRIRTVAERAREVVPASIRAIRADAAADEHGTEPVP
ncbi:LysR family transcriptional regulator [Prauserella halophila]|uniref:LysR family transcriptional regulator n=1 Tax=Prauserella halophila TaxID=185641 RepID=A0ABP4GNG6_9PSEU|nr:LysR family transcriptional regulator [Prauserella halophila]MCP2236514.1 transcriptional regulator, LysR family [Prauserella halophila]